MNSFENKDKKPEDEKNNFSQKVLLFLFFAGAIIYAWYLGLFDKTTKGKLAEEYGVEVKVLMKWLELFGTEDAKKKYIGNIDNTIKRLDFIDCLGKPEAYLKDDKDISIFTKPQISKAGLVSERTMLRRIRKIEFPSKVIGMPLDTYFTLKYFPPKHANLIIEYLKSLDVSSKNQHT